MVQLILKQNEKFKKFLLALDERNFFKAHEIARENTILQRIPTYEKLKNELEFKLEQIELFLHSGDTKKAKETINVIQNIPYLKDKIEFFLDKCVQVELLNSYYEKNDFKACYETLDKHQYLQKTQLAQLLKKHWESLIQKCEYFALKGNVLAVKKTLGELVTLRSRVSKIGDLFRLAFHVKIKESLSLRNFKDVEKLIYRYSDLFGVDIEIKELMKKYEQKTQNKLALTQDSNITRDSWIDSNFVK
jgi:hypothetical protein